jgi:CheY-like chemotaxis protein
MELLQADPTTAKIPVHFVSALDGDERGMALGAIGYLTKPATRRDLVRVVRTLTAGANDSLCRVLIIEDDPLEADSLAQRLEGTRVDVHQATTAEQALRLLEKLRFHCVIVDLGLPDMDGLKLLQSLQERSGTTPPSIVVYTGRALSRAETQRLEAYADSVVLKGSEGGERLLDRVRAFAQALQDGTPVQRTHTPDATLRLDGLKVLLVDDDMRTVYALSALLRAKGANVQVADTGRAALVELNAHPDVEIVLMDIMMPEMDGYEAMRQIRKDARFQRLPIVALTAKAMKGDSERCLESGATDYLPKPIDPDRLVSLLRSAMSGELRLAPLARAHD